MARETEIKLSSAVTRAIRRHRIPQIIVDRLLFWVDAVSNDGLEEVRKVPGWNDHALRGDRAGQRAIRLNRQWRAIYEIDEDGAVRLITIAEVTPHDY